MIDRDEVVAWVQGYERAWRDGDLSGVERLFTPDATYSRSPYQALDIGHDGIKAFWLDDEGEVFAMTAEVVAVDGDQAVVRVEVHYGDPPRQEYRDLWVLHFAADGRVDRYEEWPFWPGRGHTPLHPGHLGLCVSDLDRSLRFYCDGLGFQRAEGYDLDDTMLPNLGSALEVTTPVELRSQMITLGALKIELLAYASPQPTGVPSASRGQLGFTHLAFTVPDVEATAQRLVESGGTRVPGTDTTVGIRLAFVADPDGTRIELLAG